MKKRCSIPKAFWLPPPEGWHYGRVHYSDDVLLKYLIPRPECLSLLLDPKTVARYTRSATRTAAAVDTFGVMREIDLDTDSRVNELLLRLLEHHPSSEVQMAALGSLGVRSVRIGPSLIKRLNLNNQWVRVGYQKYLRHMFPSKAISFCIRDLEHPNSRVRFCAANTLDDMGAIKALPKIERLLNDPDEDVRWIAKWFVDRVNDVPFENRKP